MDWLGKNFELLYSYLAKQTEESGHQIMLFGIVMMINFPLFGILWKLESFPMPDEFFLRFIATLLCAGLVLSRFWPQSWLKWFPVYWYFTLFFCLPFFFCYLTLENQCSSPWLMNCVSALFFLFLVTSVWVLCFY